MYRIIRYTLPRNAGFAPAFTPGRLWAGLDPLLPDEAAFPVRVHEDKDNIYVQAELPGVRKEDIKIELAEGCLNLSATRQEPDFTGQTSPRTFARSLCLEGAVQEGKVSALYENGVLTVTLPKPEEVKPRTINVAIN